MSETGICHAGEWSFRSVEVCISAILVLPLVACFLSENSLLGKQAQQRGAAVSRATPYAWTAGPDDYLSNDFEASDEELARVILGSHRVEDCPEKAIQRRVKGECGLADYEAQTWHGWYHHVTFSLLASWFLTKETMRGQKK